MSIKSDRWIRRMAASSGMIEPFSPEQVRVANGHKIVSYGTSSYGYDVRCADEFKIFTNINSTIVDPKAFDEKSFVDFRGPVCIIPPNSFALASTVEFFRIPRSVLTVCLGKCVTGDTRLVDADTGAYVPITEMRWGKTTLAWDGSTLRRSKVSAFIPQGTREVFELRTRAGLRIRATANHPFLTLKRWAPLGEMKIGDRIAVVREIPVFGKTPILEAQASLLGSMIAEGQCDTLDESIPQLIFTAPECSVRPFLQALFSGGGVYEGGRGGSLEYHSRSRRLLEDVHHLLLRFGIFSLIRETRAANGSAACELKITDKDQVRRFAERIGFLAGSVKQQLLEENVLRDEAWPTTAAAQSVGGHTASAFDRQVQSNESMPTSSAEGPVWDVVESIESVGSEEVFDITVPTLHNFVANDFIVHNSTYARCFRGDTRVALVDGTSPSLEAMAQRHEAGESFWGYSIGKNGRLVVSLLDAPRYIGRDSLLEVELDTGECIYATPDHLFMRRDGTMAPAHGLRPGDALMPLYRELLRGEERVYQPSDGSLVSTRRLAEEAAGMDRNRSVFRRVSGGIAGVTGAPAYRNHTVAAVRELSGDHDVYCLTVPQTGNFALESGVFVHNCGIIVNVTPLEPEWEGHVTLEFSNTTPLPAKIYANEGVAQMLFFEADEICETSYRDRGGKYQGQRGVTLPKT